MALGGFIAGMFGGDLPAFKVGDVVQRIPRTFDGRMRTGARPLRRYVVARVVDGYLWLVALSGGKVDAMPEDVFPGDYTLAADQAVTFSGPFAERFARNYERIKAGGGKLRTGRPLHD